MGRWFDARQFGLGDTRIRNHDGHVNAADIPAMMAALTDLNTYKSSNGLSAASLVSLGDLMATRR